MAFSKKFTPRRENQMITNEKFIKNKGNICPKCESKNIEFHSEGSGEFYEEIMKCSDCNCVFSKVFTVTSFSVYPE